MKKNVVLLSFLLFAIVFALAAAGPALNRLGAEAFLVFEDDFDDGILDGWGVRSTGDGNVAVESGELSFSGVYANAAWPVSLVFDDFALEYDLNILSASGTTETYFRATNVSEPIADGYMLSVRSGNDPAESGLSLYKWDSSGNRWLTLGSAYFQYQLETWYHFKIVAVADRIRVFIDGSKRMDVVDATFTIGNIRLGSWEDPDMGWTDEHVHFDNVKIASGYQPLLMASRNEFSIETGSQKLVSFQLLNEDDIAHSAVLEIINPFFDLTVTFSGSNAINLEPMDTQTFIVAVDATGAVPGLYDFQVKATNEAGDAVYSSILVHVLEQCDSYESTAAHWSFDDEADLGHDDSGHGNHGLVQGGVGLHDGVAGSAAYFDGIDDGIAGPYAGITGITNEFTISLWAYPSGNHEMDTERTSGTHGVVGQKYVIGPAHGNSWGNGHAGVGVSIGQNGVSVYEHADSYMPALLVWQAPSLLNEWTHIAIVYKGRRPSLYVNGEWVKTGLTSPKACVHPGLAYSYIGKHVYGNFQGYLDEVHIHDCALSPAEVTALYDRDDPDLDGVANSQDNCPFTFNPDQSSSYREGILAYYPLDGNPNDESGNLSHGVAEGELVYENGVVGLSAHFDGIDDGIRGASCLKRIANNFTIAFWAFPLDTHELDTERNSGTEGVYNQKYAIGPAHGGAWGVDHAGAGVSVGQNGVSVYEHAEYYLPALLVWQAPSPLEGWTHIALVYEDKQPRLYINGEWVKTGLTSPKAYVHPGLANSYIGKHEYGNFRGNLDEVRIYHRVLSEMEIYQLAEGAAVQRVGNVLQMPASREISVQQGAQKTFLLELVNVDDISHSADLEILNPYSGIEVLLGDTHLNLAAGEVKAIPVSVDAASVPGGVYEMQIRLTADDENEADIFYANLKVSVMAQGAADLPDLSISSGDIFFSILQPQPGDVFNLKARVYNKGSASADGVQVRFYDFDTLLGEATIDTIAPNSVKIASAQVSFESAGERPIRVVVDAAEAIDEFDETNNESSQILVVGSAPQAAGSILVTGSLPARAFAGSLFNLNGSAFYEIFINGERNISYVVKGGAVTIAVQDPQGSHAGVYGDVYTDINGRFTKLLHAPSVPGVYDIVMSVTDNTFVGQRMLTLTVVEPTPVSMPPPPPTTSGSGSWSYSSGTGSWTWTWTDPPVNEPVPQSDLYVHSEDIHFSNNNPAAGEEVTLAANIHYWALNTTIVPRIINVKFYVTLAGSSRFMVGETIVDRISVGSPDFGSRYVFASWKNQAEGIYIVEVEITSLDPNWAEENVLNNVATRAILVGALDPGYGAISGHVTDPWGGVGGVSLDLLDANGLLTSTTTDDSGGYIFSDLAEGHYQVFLATPPGYLADADTKETDVIGQQISMVNFALSIQNKPIVEVGPGVTINEGDTFSGSGSFVDPDPDTWTATVDYGDGTGVQDLLVNEDKTFGLSHKFVDNGVYTVVVTVMDDNGGSGTNVFTVTVNNLPPTVETIYGPMEPTVAGAEISVIAAFTDPGILDYHTASWDWGDGSSTTGVVDETGGSGTVTGTKVFDAPGVYILSLTATDKDGDSGSAKFQYIVVYDPDGGFVTGGGWIWSPAGAYASEPDLEGRANFGFVAKYKKGADVPIGETEFQFKVADLNFHSTSYQWLVVAGAKAMFKGVGTINGESSYGFMLSAVDAALTPSTEEDLFRIKIWDATSEDLVVYDNLMGDADDADPTTAIQGGSIVIHTK